MDKGKSGQGGKPGGGKQDAGGKSGSPTPAGMKPMGDGNAKPVNDKVENKG